MATSPPPLPSARKDLRLASALNLSVPGVGLIYLGQRKLGAALALGFMGCFVTAIAMFVIGYARYLTFAMSDHILEGDNIEQAGHAFPRFWLAGLAIAATAIYVWSMILLRSAKRKLALPQRAR
jgi:hypothetical protein